MRNFIVIFASVTLILTEGQPNDTVSITKLNYTNNKNYLREIEVPDNALMLLDRIPFRYPAAKYSRSRQDQEVANSTETPTRRRPCTCSYGVCKCCTGVVMDLFNQKACMKVTYYPGDFAFHVAMSWNDRILYDNTMSGKNPKPICISPPRLSNLKVCAKFYNIFFPGRNFHFCLAMSGRWRSVDLFDLTFDCLRMGANGIAMMKPDESGGLEIPNPQGGVDAVIESGEDDIEDYDENVVKSIFSAFDDDDEDEDDDEYDDR